MTTITVIDGLTYFGDRRATAAEFRAWADARIEANRLANEAKAPKLLPPVAPRRTGSGPVAQFDPESGVMLVDGDPGFNPYLSSPAPVRNAQDRYLGDEDLDTVLARAQALDTVKAKEQRRYDRLVAAAAGEPIPSPIDGGHRAANGKAYDASDCPRERTRLEAIANWAADGGGAGFIYEPPSGLDALAARKEKDELNFIARREAALDVLRRTTEAQRASKADPGRPTPYFPWQKV